jgi:hypothetical protein
MCAEATHCVVLPTCHCLCQLNLLKDFFAQLITPLL